MGMRDIYLNIRMFNLHRGILAYQQMCYGVLHIFNIFSHEIHKNYEYGTYFLLNIHVLFE